MVARLRKKSRVRSRRAPPRWRAGVARFQPTAAETTPAASRSADVLSVRSQVKSRSSRPRASLAMPAEEDARAWRARPFAVSADSRGDDAGCLPQRRRLVRALPGEITVIATKVPVGGRLREDRPP